MVSPSSTSRRRPGPSASATRRTAWGTSAPLMVTLVVWLAMIVVAYFRKRALTSDRRQSGGASPWGSSPRSRRPRHGGVFAPEGRQAEFSGFGIWRFGSPPSWGRFSYGMITWVTGNDHRLAICATGLFFLLAIVVLVPLNVEARGGAGEGNEREGGGVTEALPEEARTSGVPDGSALFS